MDAARDAVAAMTIMSLAVLAPRPRLPQTSRSLAESPAEQSRVEPHAGARRNDAPVDHTEA